MCGCRNLQLIQSHVAPSRGPPARVLSPLFFQAKSLLLPKPRGKREHPKAVWSSPFSAKAMWSAPFSAKAMWSSPGIAAVPGFKSQRQSSSAAPFLTPPTTSYTCQHPRILPAFVGCHIKSGQAWPYGMEPIFSKLSCRRCDQGELPPSYILGGSHSHPSGSKHGHSHLTYL